MININVPITKWGSDDNKYFLITLNEKSIGAEALSELNKLQFKYNLINIKISRPQTLKTYEQVKTIHALIGAFLYSGCHSAPKEACGSLDKFKLWVKCQHGVCIDHEFENKQYRIPISIADYSKQELSEFIDKLKSVIIQSGALAESKKLQEIFAGMDEKNGRT
jgi:hypothetical protein